ncbi:MAG: UDP-3-O-(3-hydroxymyristoyl)glucosamine N-acyltransferase [Halanaerobiaceae bacterium]
MVVTLNKKTYTSGELAEYVSGELRGDPTLEITGVSGAKEGGKNDITFAENQSYFKDAENSAVTVIIVSENIEKSSKTIIRTANPRLAYAKISKLFAPDVFYSPRISLSAEVSESATIGSNVSIHSGVIIDDNVEIGDNTIIAPGVYIGENTKIGSDTLIHPNVVIEYNSIIGSNVIIHSGTVIGSDGYGFVTTGDGHYKIHQLGNVIIEDDVEIGANVTVDRGASGPTVIGSGTKIDNLVQIAHNVKIGPMCLIVAQVGIAGSTELGEKVTMAGKTGSIGHLKIGNNATIASKGLVTKNIPEGVFYSGNPAHDHKEELREQASIRKLPELLKTIKKLEDRVKQLERGL